MGGFVPIGTTDGADYHGKLQVVQFQVLDPVAAFLGDMVATGSGTSAALATDRYPSVRQAVGAEGAVDTPDTLLGAIVEFLPDFTDEGSLVTNYRTPLTAQSARITHGSAVIYGAECDNAVTALDGTDIGSLVDLTQPAGPFVPPDIGSGDEITGISGQVLDASSAGTSGTQLLIRSFNELQGDRQGVPPGVVDTPQIWNVSIASEIAAGASLRGG